MEDFKNEIIHDGILIKNQENSVKEDSVKEDSVKEDSVKEDSVKEDSVKEDSVKEEDNIEEETKSIESISCDEEDEDENDDEEDTKEKSEEMDKMLHFLKQMEQRKKEKEEAEAGFKSFIQHMLMKKFEQKIKKDVNKGDENSDDSDDDSDEDTSFIKRSVSGNTSNVIFNLNSLMTPFLLLTCVNIFMFIYNNNCAQFYYTHIDSNKRFDIVYSLFQYFRDNFIFSMIEKIFYVLIFLHIINTVIGMILSYLLPKDGIKIKGSSSGLGGLSDLFGHKEQKYKIEEKGKTGVTFNDVAGCHIAKKELLELIDFLQNREKYTKLGAQLPKGALLYGPSGTGKTMIAKALAHEVSYNYIYVQGSDFKKPLVGLGPQSVKDLFETARKNAPCIIFVDEIDSIAKKRGSESHGGGASHSEEDAVLNTFLAELDGFKDRGDVFVMGATNRLNVIDDALLRPKRFDRIIHFKLPNVDERYEIVGSYFNKMKVNKVLCNEEYKRLLAKKSYGFSGAQIFNMCNEACILAGKENGNEVLEKHIHEALDYIHLGKTEEHVKAHLSDEEKKRTAYHETGHAVVAIMRSELENPTQISIVPHNKGSLGVTLTPINEHKYSKTREDYIARLCMLLGGRMAEEIFIGNVSGGAKDDLNKFNALVDDYFNSGIEDIYLMDDNDYRHTKVKVSEKYLLDMEEKKRAFIDNVYTTTKNILQEHNSTVHFIAKELLEKEDMYEDDISKYLINKDKR
jgi:ATP-dependent metalloprotease FtsH